MVENPGGRERTGPRGNGAAIKALRIAYGWKTDPFAAKVGISTPYLVNIEAGRKPGSPDVLRKIAETLNVPLAAITSGYDDGEVAALVAAAPEQVAS